MPVSLMTWPWMFVGTRAVTFPVEVSGTLIRLLSVCAREWNGGRIYHAETFDDRQWNAVAGITRAQVDAVIVLGAAMFQDGALVLPEYMADEADGTFDSFEEKKS
jgi:hypothetical protein